MKKIININTVTPTYDLNEDRIRLAINYQDVHNRIDMMLTRSFLLKLLPTIEEFVYKFYPNESIEDNVKIEVTYSNDTDESNNTPAQSNLPANSSQTILEDLELYKGLEDLLITANFSYDRKTQLTTIVFISKENHQASIVCNIDIIKSLISTIKQSVPKLQWGIIF